MKNLNYELRSHLFSVTWLNLTIIFDSWYLHFDREWHIHWFGVVLGNTDVCMETSKIDADCSGNTADICPGGYYLILKAMVFINISI